MENSLSKEKQLDPIKLAQFIGSEKFYRHSSVTEIIYSEGARYVAEVGGAYWLLDEIAFAQRSEPAVRKEPFQVWDLYVTSFRSAILSCADGNRTTVYKKKIKWTDFPPPGIQLFVANSCIHLPSEY